MKRFLNAAFVLSLFGLLGFALAQTGAGTPIENTATATYTNAANQSLTATSNTVTTTVQPIYRFAITPDGTDDPYVAGNGTGAGQTQTGPAGGTSVFTYQLENQGNTGNPGNATYPSGNTINLSAVDSGTDDFDFGTKTIYRDNPAGGPGNVGVLDAGDFNLGTTTGSITLNYGEVVTLFVEAAIDPNATDNQVGRLNLVGTSAIGNETDNNNWAELTAFTNAALTISKTATGNVIPGGTIEYNVSGANTGGTNPYTVSAVANITDATPAGSRDGILVSDVIPTGLTYVQDSLVLSGSNTTSNTVARLYSTNGGTSWTLAQPASGVDAVALLIVGSSGQRINTTGGAPFAYEFTFQATAPANAVAGANQYPNTGRVRFDSNGNGNSADTGEDLTSATVTTTVDPSGAFAVGPYTFPNGDAPVTPASTYTVPGEGYTVTRSGDTQTIASVPNEREVSFRHSLQNAANFDDTFTLSSTPPAALPGSVSFYAVNGDGSRGAAITTLDAAAGATEEFYAVVTLPADYTTPAPLNFTVTATAATNTATTTDSTTDTISKVTEAQAVNIGNYDGTGTPNDTLIDFPAQPNSTVNIPLIVRNDGADTDTFDLDAVIVPAGYTVTLYSDNNCDGDVNGAAPNADAVVTDSGALDAGAFACFTLQVTVPAGAAPATYDVTVTATSQNDPNISDFITDTVTVGLSQDFTFTPTPQSQATSATVPVVYTHTVTNNSNDAALVTLTFAEEDATVWTYEYSLTGAEGSYGTLAAVNTALQTSPVAAGGGTQDVYVRVTPDTGAAQGTTDAFTLTATPTYGATTGDPASVTDTTTIDQQFFGQLNLTKVVSVNGAAPTDAPTEAVPGDTLTYTVTATNSGSGALNNVKVVDAVPANTTFVSVSASASGDLTGDRVLYSTNGTSWSQTPPATLATGSSIYIGVSTNGDNTIDANDAFPGSGAATAPTDPGVVTLTLTVTIN